LEYEEFDAKFSDGESYISHGYFDNEKLASHFTKGKLYGKAPSNSYIASFKKKNKDK